MTSAQGQSPASERQLRPAGTRLGAVHIGVTGMERALELWSGRLGLSVMQEDAGTVSVVAGGLELIVLHGDADAPVARNHTGLYHVAIHFDSRKEFARALARLSAHGYPHSQTDHLVTETSYLSDPDS